MAVLVLGMHRSGTSAVAGTAVRLGVAPPKTMLPPSHDNPSGFYESPLVVGLNHLILHTAGCTWADCLAFDPNQIDEASRAMAIDISVSVLRDEFAHATAFLIKDPRLSLTLPIWLPVLQASGTLVTIFLVIRHPNEVARSLLRRDNLPVSAAAPLWLHYCLEAERASRSLSRAVVFYDDLLRDWRGCMALAGQTARIAWPSLDQPDIDGFLSWTLRHHVASQNPEPVGPPPVRDMIDMAWPAFRELRDNPESTSARHRLDQVYAAFTSFRHSAGEQAWQSAAAD